MKRSLNISIACVFRTQLRPNVRYDFQEQGSLQLGRTIYARGLLILFPFKIADTQNRSQGMDVML